MRVHTNLPRGDLDIDLESGETSSEEDLNENRVFIGDDAKKLLGEKPHKFARLDESSRSSEDSLNSYNASLNSSHISIENVEVFSDNSGEETMNFVDVFEKKRRKLNSGKKPPKPPRPPLGPSLNAADMKLVKEISEYALLKRKRAKRMKELKKRRSEKSSSPFYGNLFALVVTVLFFFVIVFQGHLGSYAP